MLIYNKQNSFKLWWKHFELKGNYNKCPMFSSFCKDRYLNFIIFETTSIFETSNSNLLSLHSQIMNLYSATTQLNMNTIKHFLSYVCSNFMKLLKDFWVKFYMQE